MLSRTPRTVPPLIVVLVGLLISGAPAGARTPRSARTPTTGRASTLVRIGSAPVLPAGTQPAATAASAGPKLGVTVALAPRNGRALAAYAAEVQDPSSPAYHQYLRPAQFVARFAPSERTIRRVTGALRRAGLVFRGLAADHLSLHLSADAGTYERAWHLELAHMRLPSGRTVLVNLEAPALPASVAPDVQAIIGLDGISQMESTRTATYAGLESLNPSSATSTTRRRHARQIPEACSQASSVASAQGAYSANQIAGAYAFDPLYAAGDQGAGVNIGVYELEPNSPGDIAAYQACYGTAAPVSYAQVDGGAGSGAGSGEAAFDIEQIIGLAPQAHLVIYQGPNSNSDNPGSGPYDIFATMISQDRVSIISNSWGECEAEEGARDARAENTLFEEAAVQGQSVLSAAGDYGSEDCDGATTASADTLAVDDPGSQPFVTDVGGTSLTALGPPLTQTTWDDDGAVPARDLGPGAGAGGGGISSLWTMPAYQSSAPSGLNVVNPDSSTQPCGSVGVCREVPDVSADADPAHGYLIYYNGDHSVTGQPSGWQASGGTSGAAPLWAAVFAETNADPACAGSPLGFANPALYRAAATSQDSDFGDVSGGNNDFTQSNSGLYPATPGYDMATGLGSPNAAALAGALCAESLRLTVPASLQSFVRTARTLSVSDADAGASVTVEVSGLPDGVRYDPATRLISGTPTRAGTHAVTVTAFDTFGAVRVARFGWKVADRPTVSHLVLTGATGAQPALALRVSSGRAEAALSTVALELPAGLALLNRARVKVTTAAGGRIRAAATGSGRRVLITLAQTATTVVVHFDPGGLSETGTLRMAARRSARPAYAISAVVRDAAGASSGVHGSARSWT